MGYGRCNAASAGVLALQMAILQTNLTPGLIVHAY
jgi:hypothetical protein